MPNYNRWRKNIGITNPEMIEALRQEFPEFSKVTASMINNPKAYGVRLTLKAERALAKKYGLGKGLSIRKMPKEGGYEQSQ